MKDFDPLLLQGLPYRNGEIDKKRLRFYNLILNAMKVCGAISFLLGFVIIGSQLNTRKALILGENLSAYVYFIGLLFFVMFCIIFALLMLHFLSLKIKTNKQALKLLTPYKNDTKTKLLRYFQVFSIVSLCILFFLLSFKYVGFLIFHILLLAIPKIKVIYTNDNTLYAEFCIVLGLVALGLYPIKNNKDLYYCEFTFSQSVIPLRIQQIAFCAFEDNHLIKYRTFGFERNIDSKEFIEIINKRAIVQEKTPDTQNTKIDTKEI